MMNPTLYTSPVPVSGTLYIVLKGVDGSKWVYSTEGWKKVGWFGFLFPWRVK